MPTVRTSCRPAYAGSPHALHRAPSNRGRDGVAGRVSSEVGMLAASSRNERPQRGLAAMEAREAGRSPSWRYISRPTMAVNSRCGRSLRAPSAIRTPRGGLPAANYGCGCSRRELAATSERRRVGPELSHLGKRQGRTASAGNPSVGKRSHRAPAAIGGLPPTAHDRRPIKPRTSAAKRPRGGRSVKVDAFREALTASILTELRVS